MKNYNPKDIEIYYDFWQTNGFFDTSSGEKGNFCIMMPPPNVTGSLHIGHALTFSLQDIMVRFKRSDGYKTLWQPGTDHASIAVENIIEKQLASEGLTKEGVGKKEFLKRTWIWKEKSGGDIIHQLKKLGVSPSWERERFTMDEGLSEAVKKSFVQLYNEGNIFKGNYLINWCTKCGALSDIEVEYEEHEGHMYHVRYALKEGGHVVVATTRPETYFGDTAVMVHPDDKRYSHLIGKTAILPIINKEIPIIADEFVDMDFGSGVVKVTPAHDPNDYEVGQRHNLDVRVVFDEKGVLNESCASFAGLNVLDARSAVIKALEDGGFMEQITPHSHQVGHCYRCHKVIEPYISKQWFIKKELAQKAIKLVDEGKVAFFPASWKNNYKAWMSELRDWCISRQLYWGHEIPVYYCNSCGEEFASVQSPRGCEKCNSKDIRQDEDVLDTWFSSALWPFSTLGWGNDTNRSKPSDLKDFYPNTLLITGFDILFFWVARMIMFGVHFMGDVPFKSVYLHALVRDEHGQKMSKSKGNVINPLEIIDEIGADTLRFTLAALAVQGRDIKLARHHLLQYRNFTNKIYNASNYLLLQHESFGQLDPSQIKTKLGKYVLSRFYDLITQTRMHLDNYRFNDAAMSIYKFFWNDFCDNGIEFSKKDPASSLEIGVIFKESMVLLHPFMPFLSENIYQKLGKTSLTKENSIMQKPFPVAQKRDMQLEGEFSLIIEAIASIRRAKLHIGMANKPIKKAFLLVKGGLDLEIIKKLAKCEEVEIITQKPNSCVSDVSENLQSFIQTDSANLQELKEKLNTQIEKNEKETQKIKVLLDNPNFIDRAPKELVKQNEEKITKLQEQREKLDDELESLA